MALFNPTRGRPPIPHPSSYNANPISMVAGATALEVLTREVIERLNTQGESLRQQIRAAFGEAGLPAQVTGLGSLFGLHLTPDPVRSSREALRADADLCHRLFLGLFNEGVLIDPRGVGCVSLAIGDAEISQFVTALRAVLPTLSGGISGRR
jgi:glutamate-1-semialdehyde 2,1-aminomutase